MEHNIRRLLGIQGWVVHEAREEGGRLVVRVGKRRKGARCERCRERSLRVHQRMHLRQVWHLAVAGRPVYLEFRPRRYWCRRCQRVFTEAYEEIRKWARRTKLGEALLLGELSGQSFGAVERKTGIGYTALRGAVERAEVGVKWAEILEGAGEGGFIWGSMSTVFGVNRWWAPSRRSGSAESWGFFGTTVRRH